MLDSAMDPSCTPRVAGLPPLGTDVEEQGHCQGSSSPATHQRAWKSLVEQTESLGLEEMRVMPANPFVAETFLVRRKKRKISVCFFRRRLLSARSLYLVIIKGLFCCQ